MKTILIIEDDPQHRLIIQRKLQNEGYQVLIAGNGQEALRILQNSTIDLILLDLIMPVMDGFSFVHNLKALNKDIPIIVLTNLPRSPHESFIKDFMLKSDTSLDDVVKRVKSHFVTE